MFKLFLLTSLFFMTCEASFFSLFSRITIPHTVEQFREHIIPLASSMEPNEFERQVIADDEFQALLGDHTIECKDFLKDNLRLLHYTTSPLPSIYRGSIHTPTAYMQYEDLWSYRVYASSITIGKGPLAGQQRKWEHKSSCIFALLDKLFDYQPTPLELIRG